MVGLLNEAQAGSNEAVCAVHIAVTRSAVWAHSWDCAPGAAASHNAGGPSSHRCASVSAAAAGQAAARPPLCDSV